MNTEIIQIELERAAEMAWANFQKGMPFTTVPNSFKEACRLCFFAGFLDGVKLKNVSEQLGKKK